ncbi:hypothetical protein N7533_000285 [Penicillium manginii]|uniref:uncharacterized protein n=1 Tax=Penicillium manginii TaxID=203109 RepID=UPI002546F6B3|nr:uncharacterized protein N7533_000285 [Penicillium manginii]KAJ5767702.1 hypothetical protein N7533_000285 [Penicillium manginii]
MPRQTRAAPVQNVAKMMIEARRQKRREKKRKYRLRKAARKKQQEAPSGAEITEPPQANDSLPKGLYPLCSGLPDWNLLKVEDDNKSKI